MKAKYGEGDHDWSCSALIGLVWCGVRKGISRGMEAFCRCIKFKVNKGNRVRF